MGVNSYDHLPISDKVLQKLAKCDPLEFDKLSMIEDIVEYELTFVTLSEATDGLSGNFEVTLGDAIANARTSLRDRLRASDYDTIRGMYNVLFKPMEEAIEKEGNTYEM